MQNTPTHRMQLSEPVRAVTTYTEIPVQAVQREKPVKKPAEARAVEPKTEPAKQEDKQ